jgi:DNA-binding protein YbaB
MSTKKPVIANAHKLKVEAEAAKILRNGIKELMGLGIDDEVVDEGDKATLRDTMEGETSLLELIAKVDEDQLKDEASVLGLKEMMKKLKERCERIDARMEKRKATILLAMGVAEQQKIELPTGTISVKRKPRAVEIIDETQLPSIYWKDQDPVIDKKAVNEAWKRLEEARANAATPEERVALVDIPGTRLDNGGESLSIRR